MGTTWCWTMCIQKQHINKQDRGVCVCVCVLVAGLSSLTWPESGWGCRPVVYWVIKAHGLNQPSCAMTCQSHMPFALAVIFCQPSATIQIIAMVMLIRLTNSPVTVTVFRCINSATFIRLKQELDLKKSVLPFLGQIKIKWPFCYYKMCAMQRAKYGD